MIKTELKLYATVARTELVVHACRSAKKNNGLLQLQMANPTRSTDMFAGTKLRCSILVQACYCCLCVHQIPAPECSRRQLVSTTVCMNQLCYSKDICTPTLLEKTADNETLARAYCYTGQILKFSQKPKQRKPKFPLPSSGLLYKHD